MRAFVAVVPPAEAVEPLQAAVERLRPAYAGLGWVAKERWHVTLAFLGDVDEGRLPRLQRELAQLADTDPFELRVAGAGCFPRPSRPQVLWAGLEGDVTALEGFAATVTRACRAAKTAPDLKPFRAHITVARARRSPVDVAPLLAALDDVAGPPWSADRFALYRSHLGPQPRYEELAGWPLGHQA